MYLLILYQKGGGREFFGPFPTEERTLDYREAAIGSGIYLLTYEIQPLIVPHLVKKVEWKEDML